jgi:hypothetical protein
MGLRSLAIGLFSFAADLLAGPVLGAVQPARQRRLPERDGRERALAALRAYVAAVPVSDPTREGQTFKLSKDDIHAEYADAEHVPELPAAGVVSADADLGFEYLGGPIVLDDTYERFAPRSALALFGWHDEQVVLEVWCRDVPQRRAVVAALKAAFWASEGRGCVDLRLDDYYCQSARFTLAGAHVIDEPESLRGGRRRALLRLRLRVPEVLLVDAGTMRPLHEVEVTQGT